MDEMRALSEKITSLKAAQSNMRASMNSLGRPGAVVTREYLEAQAAKIGDEIAMAEAEFRKLVG